jgi:hypothetical protein
MSFSTRFDQVSGNDIVLVLSLLYLCIDIQYEWEDFSTCTQPVHLWLLVSYLLIILSRVIYMAGNLGQAADVGDFLLNLRQRTVVLRRLVHFTWLVLLPFYAFWTVLGSFWLANVRRASPYCLPNSVHLWFLVVWQVLSYLWIVIHGGLGFMAWILERKVQSVEENLSRIEDEELLSRWGQVSRLSGYTALQGMSGGGLSPAELDDLPSNVYLEKDMSAEEGEADDTDTECPICLVGFQPGDAVRELQQCGHSFHKCCIDLWLIRSLDCPLCKRKVRGKSCVSLCDSYSTPTARV